MICDLCHGRGTDVILECSSCEGTGVEPDFEDEKIRQCQECAGTGEEHHDECPACGGEGKVDDD